MAEGAPVEGSIRWHSGTGKWQQNWFCLKTAPESGTAPSLVYSKARSTPTLGSISLAVLHKVTPADGADVSGWKQEYQGRCVQLEVGGEDGGAASAIHYLLADNRGEMLRWMKALSKIKGAQRKESLRTTLASVSKGAPSSSSPSSPTTSTFNPDNTPPSLSPPPESRPRAASQSSSSPAPAASQLANPATNEAGARPLSVRARRQAILLDKPLRFGAQAGDSPAQDAPDTNNKDPAATAAATDTEQTKALSTAKTKVQELEERRRLITSRASVSISAAPAAAAAATTNAAAADGSGGVEPDSSSAQQRLREMELKAEQRRKQAEELVAKRQAAALMLQQRKAASRVAPAGANADAADSAEKEETETKAEKEASGYHSWKARRKNEDEAQHNMQKMLVGELQAKILPKAQQQQVEASGVDDSESDSADDDDGKRVEESSELASAAAEETSGERGTGEGDDEGERAKPQDEAVAEVRERDEEEKEREKRGDEEEEKEELEQRGGGRKGEAKRGRREKEEGRRAEEERQRQEEEKQLEEKRKEEREREEEEEERKRRQQEEAEAEEEERKREEEKEKQLEEERRKATEEEEERKRQAAKEEEEVKERQRRREEEAEEARLQAQRKAEEDKRKADELEKEKKTGDEGKATDELLKQRVEEIEEKKKRMFERMRQREKNRRDSGSAAAVGLVAAAAPKSESGGEAKLAEEAKNEELKPSEKSESDEGNEQRTKERRQSGLFAKQPPPAAPQPEPQPSTADEAAAESEKKEAMRKMLEMLSKQKAERAEERERLKKMLEERKKKKVEEYARLRSDNQSSPPSGAQAGSAGSVDTTTAATTATVDSADEDHQQQQKQRQQQQQQQEELRKLKEEMRSIRSTIVLLDRESDTLNERIAQVHVQELQERRERERQAQEEQSRLEHAMREEMMRAQALEVLLERYVPLHTPHEVRRHEQHILDETTHNAVLVNLSGILLARGRSHGNWFAHELGRTTLADGSNDAQIGEDDERVLRLKGGIVVRKRDSASEWDLLVLPEGAVMLLDREPSGLNSSAVSLGNQEQTDETPATTASAPQTSEDDGEQVKRVFFNLADAPSEPDHLSPAKKTLLVDLRQAVNNIVEHFSAAGSDQQMAALGEETASNKAITRLVRGELSTILARIFDVGFKSWKFFGAYHLWDFLEAYGQQNDSVRELAALGLRNAIKTLNTNVRMAENPNIKFRALICHGLNNKYLDEWVSLLLAHNGLMNKWYNDESLMRDARASESVIKSLGRLKNFPFAMDINFEVRPAVVRRIDSERAAAQQSPGLVPAPALSVDTAPLDDEARMRMRGVTGGSAARAAAAAAAAAQVLSVGGGVDASNRRQSAWGRPRNSEPVVNSEPKNENENEHEHEAKATVATTTTATTPAKGVTLWGSLWGGEQGQQRTSVDADELKRIDKRRGKERVRGSSDSEFLDELDEVPRLELVDEDFKIEIKEIEPGQPDRGSPGVSFFTSFLDLAKSMVDDNDD
ncbi:RUN domain containing protein [Acanthamoeba castellanii str. Neff]|uniref:RUN domain containing protein n=1 Tax=Acanthamoeba castellanii (strain ATCC 30010 / Neff) TaxID=1257118 RepID=L8GN50_ACACF|nr:RUN domain containing protein [Acanthamoeba castellanii str. Neff]ELR14412.1 RUN domain containing protein [Acanthamoeba castellanii str. Neff]